MGITLFQGFTDPSVTTFEKFGLIIVLVVAVLGLLYAMMLRGQVLRQSEGDDKMKHLASAIQKGGNAYLNKQFRTILLLVFVLAVFIYFTGTGQSSANVSAYGNPGWLIGLGRAAGFLMGATFSGLVGYIGMNMAMKANSRVAQAARSSFTQALSIGYRAGTITGMLTDGLGLLGGTIIFIIFFKDAPLVLLGFGFGGTLLALFMRVGGGIYTKAADVGADLVGKVEKSIPEDDPRNAAVIADQVGDNVGDCAGMAADIFESYEVTIVSAMILGLILNRVTGQLYWIIFPLLVRAAGVFSSIISTYSVRASKEGENALTAIRRGYILAAVISIVSFFVFSKFYTQDLRFFWATTVGILLAVAIQYITEYYTSTEHGPVKEIAKATKTGSATTILAGLATGYESTVMSVIVIAISIVASAVIWHGGGVGNTIIYIFYGVALCGIGQLTLTGNNIAMDSFGPIVDNANGIGEMAHLEPKARQILADLDAVGNTTKAVTKGIAIASAVLAAVALFAAFYSDYGLVAINLIKWQVFVAFLIGGSIPFLFSSMAIRAVGRAAYLIVNEVRFQFKVKGVWEGTVDPDYGKVVDICTGSAQKELLTPALLAIISPLVIGLLFGLEALAGFLGGVILVGQLLAVFMSNAGGAWDNAKKTIEDGLYGGKGSEAHKAAVVGDTVGDPLKDTAGPALNPLIKVINLISIISASLMVVPAAAGGFQDRGLTPVTVTLAVLGIIVIIASFLFSRKAESFGREDVEP
ncbi:MAG: sodium-translocating pyrophosphatase [Chloroflexi bacterium]|nr:sodium-translocating pyrophosphatase [Chloroflexota bacterium]